MTKFNVPSPELRVVFETVTFADLREYYADQEVSSVKLMARDIGLKRLSSRPNFSVPVSWETRTSWDDKSGRYIVIAAWIEWIPLGE